MKTELHAAISGSYRKFPEELQKAIDEFKDLGVRVLSPLSAVIVSAVEGFVSLQGDLLRIDKVSDLRKGFATVENSHLRAIAQSDFLWLIMPSGYLGPATALELGWALANKVPAYSTTKSIVASKEPMVHAYVKTIESIGKLVATFEPGSRFNPVVGYQLIDRVTREAGQDKRNATVAAGAMIVDYSKRYKRKRARDILLVETHKWGERLSIVGGRITDDEDLKAGLAREVKVQTGLEASVQELVCAFNEVPNSGYYLPGTHRIFIDRVVKAGTRSITLDHRAQRSVWMNPNEALTLPNIEPNAKYAIEEYVKAA